MERQRLQNRPTPESGIRWLRAPLSHSNRFARYRRLQASRACLSRICETCSLGCIGRAYLWMLVTRSHGCMFAAVAAAQTASMSSRPSSTANPTSRWKQPLDTGRATRSKGCTGLSGKTAIPTSSIKCCKTRSSQSTKTATLSYRSPSCRHMSTVSRRCGCVPSAFLAKERSSMPDDRRFRISLTAASCGMNETFG